MKERNDGAEVSASRSRQAPPDQTRPLRERIAALRRDILRRGRTGKFADKAFFDRFAGEGDD